MGHHHHHFGNEEFDHRYEEINGRNLLITVVLNFSITIAQLIGGILSNSLSLLADTVHNFSDGLALWISYAAYKIGRRKSNTRKTFGYKRVEILSAFINSAALFLVCFYVIFEAIQRFMNPEPVKTGIMLIIAVIGLLGNLFSVLLLNKDRDKNLNIRSAYLHLIGDTVSSVAVVIGGLAMMFWEIYIIDPIISIGICIYLINQTYHISRSSFDILLQSTPQNINIKELGRAVAKIDKVDNIHHLHVWSLDDKRVYLEAHIDLKVDMKVSEADKVRAEVADFLKANFGITHVTLQMEKDYCKDKSLIRQDAGGISDLEE